MQILFFLCLLQIKIVSKECYVSNKIKIKNTFFLLLNHLFLIIQITKTVHLIFFRHLDIQKLFYIVQNMQKNQVFILKN